MEKDIAINGSYEYHYNRCMKICNERGYDLIDVFKDKNTWYVIYDLNEYDRDGKKYDKVKQNELHFINNVIPKVKYKDNIALSTDEWVEKAKQVHPEYDFSETVYKNNKISVKIGCPKHGMFTVSPKEFLKNNYVCGKCKKEQALVDRMYDYIEKSKIKYNNKYTYFTETYTFLNKPMKMWCPEHGEFWQRLKIHLDGCGCPKCYHEKRKNVYKDTNEMKNSFIEKAKKIHGDKYDYSKVNYIDCNTKVCIICPEHDEFWQTPTGHLSGNGCPKCGKVYKPTIEEFVQKARTVHNDKYDYSKVEYKNNHTKVCIICHEKDEFGEEHGEFWQTPKIHLRGNGCSKCSGNYLDEDLFIKKSNKMHGFRYDYSMVSFKSNKDKVTIICPEHGAFTQRVNCHLQGQGCPQCKESHLERTLKQILLENHITFECQKRFEWLVNDITKYKLPLDFYLPDYNIAIECQGEQHFISSFYKSKGIEYAEEHLKGVQYRDLCKKNECERNNVKLIYFLDRKFIKFMSEDSICCTNVEELMEILNLKI